MIFSLAVFCLSNGKYNKTTYVKFTLKLKLNTYYQLLKVVILFLNNYNFFIKQYFIKKKISDYIEIILLFKIVNRCFNFNCNVDTTFIVLGGVILNYYPLHR